MHNFGANSEVISLLPNKKRELSFYMMNSCYHNNLVILLCRWENVLDYISPTTVDVQALSFLVYLPYNYDYVMNNALMNGFDTNPLSTFL